MFLGASGTGKTTLAKSVSKEFNIPFVSGSISDMDKNLPKKQIELIGGDPVAIMRREQNFLAMRYKKMVSQEGDFVTDRSFIDNLAYTVYKVSQSIPQCEIESMIDAIVNCIKDARISHIIFIPVTSDPMMNGDWKVEDNGKRITSIYFQYLVSEIMSSMIPLLIDDWWQMGAINANYESYFVASKALNCKLLVLDDYEQDVREKLIINFLNRD